MADFLAVDFDASDFSTDEGGGEPEPNYHDPFLTAASIGTILRT